MQKKFIFFEKKERKCIVSSGKLTIFANLFEKKMACFLRVKVLLHNAGITEPVDGLEPPTG